MIRNRLHHVGAARLQQFVAQGLVGLMAGLVRVPVPFVQPQATQPDRVIGPLVGPGHVAVKGDGHVAGN
jgi:hypothetical protein